MSVVFDVGQGLAFVGGRTLAVADAGPQGELRIGGDAGPVLAPITFDARTRIATLAAATGDPAAALGAGVLAAATAEPHGVDQLVLEVLALALAGADEP